MENIKINLTSDNCLHPIMGLRIVVLPHWKAGRKRCVVLKLPRKTTWQNDSANTSVSNKSDINWVIMDYLVSEGYPGAAEKFAQETNLPGPVDNESIRERVRVRNAIHGGRLDEAIELINEIDPEVSTSSLLASHLK